MKTEGCLLASGNLSNVLTICGRVPVLNEPLAHTTVTLAAVILSSWDPVGFVALSNSQRRRRPAHAFLNLQTASVTM